MDLVPESIEKNKNDDKSTDFSDNEQTDKTLSVDDKLDYISNEQLESKELFNRMMLHITPAQEITFKKAYDLLYKEEPANIDIKHRQYLEYCKVEGKLLSNNEILQDDFELYRQKLNKYTEQERISFKKQKERYDYPTRLNILYHLLSEKCVGKFSKGGRLCERDRNELYGYFCGRHKGHYFGFKDYLDNLKTKELD